MTRFELATPATRTRCATKLRYIPINLFNFHHWAQLGIFNHSAPSNLRFSIRLPYSELSTGHFLTGNLLHPDICFSGPAHLRCYLSENPQRFGFSSAESSCATSRLTFLCCQLHKDYTMESTSKL